MPGTFDSPVQLEPTKNIVGVNWSDGREYIAVTIEFSFLIFATDPSGWVEMPSFQEYSVFAYVDYYNTDKGFWQPASGIFPGNIPEGDRVISSGLVVAMATRSLTDEITVEDGFLETYTGLLGPHPMTVHRLGAKPEPVAGVPETIPVADSWLAVNTDHVAVTTGYYSANVPSNISVQFFTDGGAVTLETFTPGPIHFEGRKGTLIGFSNIFKNTASVIPSDGPDLQYLPRIASFLFELPKKGQQ